MNIKQLYRIKKLVIRTPYEHFLVHALREKWLRFEGKLTVEEQLSRIETILPSFITSPGWYLITSRQGVEQYCIIVNDQMKCYTFEVWDFLETLNELSAKELSADYINRLVQAKRIPWLHNKRIDKELSSYSWMCNNKRTRRNATKLWFKHKDLKDIKNIVKDYLHIFC